MKKTKPFPFKLLIATTGIFIFITLNTRNAVPILITAGVIEILLILSVMVLFPALYQLMMMIPRGATKWLENKRLSQKDESSLKIQEVKAERYRQLTRAEEISASREQDELRKIERQETIAKLEKDTELIHKIKELSSNFPLSQILKVLLLKLKNIKKGDVRGTAISDMLLLYNDLIPTAFEVAGMPDIKKSCSVIKDISRYAQVETMMDMIFGLKQRAKDDLEMRKIDDDEMKARLELYENMKKRDFQEIFSSQVVRRTK